MPLTPRKFVRRSRCSSAISTLDPQGEKNFFEFYKKNSVPIDQILTARINCSGAGISYEDEGDLRQDVLFKLHRCNILGQYDKGKSHFNTYLTTKVDCYVRIWLRQKRQSDHHKWTPWATQGYARPEDGTLRFEREYYPSLNGLNPDNLEKDLSVEAGFDEEYCTREMVDLMLKNLPSNLRPFLHLMVDGLSRSDLAKMLKVSSSTIQDQVKKIKAQGKRILKDLPF